MTEIEIALPEEAVRIRSYLIWEREGCPAGKELDHWRQAREELQAELHAGPSLHKSTAVVAPRLPISTRPNKTVSIRFTLKQASARVTAATR
jgi:hypothetical protein